MFCLTNVRVFSERHKHNLKDNDMLWYIEILYKIHSEITRGRENKEKKYKREDTFTIAIP